MTIELALFYLFSSLALISGVMVIRAKNPVHSVLFLILVFCNAAGLLILLDLDFFAMIFLVVYVGAIAVLFLFVVMMLNIKVAEINENILRYLPIGGLIGIIFLFEIFLIVDNDLIPTLQFQDASALSLFESFQYSIGFFLSSIWSILRAKTSFSQLTPNYREFQTDLAHIATYSENLQYQNTELAPYIQWALQMDQVTNIQALGQVIYTYYFAYFILASFILLVAMIGAIVLTMHKSITVRRQEVFEQNTREFAQTVQKIRI